MPPGIVFSRSHIDNTELRRPQLRAQFLRSCEQRFARVLFLHWFPIALVKMALQIKQTRFKFSMQLGVTAVLVSVGIFISGFTYPTRTTGPQTVFPRGPLLPPRLQNRIVVLHWTLGSQERQALRLSGDLFRFGVRDRQNGSSQAPLFTDLYMAHFALSDIAAKKFLFRERINRGYGDRAGALTDRYLVWNEDWRVEGAEKHHRLQVKDRATQLQLSLTSLKPPVLHGQNGLSQKGEGEGRASYYSSLTRMQTEGELTVDEKKARVRGLTWMDHEFGSNQLREDQVGWDWFGVHSTIRRN